MEMHTHFLSFDLSHGPAERLLGPKICISLSSTHAPGMVRSVVAGAGNGALIVPSFAKEKFQGKPLEEIAAGLLGCWANC